MTQDLSRFKQLVADAKTRITEIDAADLQDELAHTPPATLLIDVREATDWQQSHLPAAIPVSRGLLELKIEALAPDLDTAITLYCGGGSRSALAADSLQKMGYKNVRSLKAGFSGWLADNRPTEHAS